MRHGDSKRRYSTCFPCAWAQVKLEEAAHAVRGSPKIPREARSRRALHPRTSRLSSLIIRGGSWDTDWPIQSAQCEYYAEKSPALILYSSVTRGRRLAIATGSQRPASCPGDLIFSPLSVPPCHPRTLNAVLAAAKRLNDV